jgi:ABC-type sulfate/molybdate transport systems ATPase subunit
VAVVLVSHDPMAAVYADRVFSLRDGKLSVHEVDPAHAPLPAGAPSTAGAPLPSGVPPLTAGRR